MKQVLAIAAMAALIVCLPAHSESPATSPDFAPATSPATSPVTAPDPAPANCNGASVSGAVRDTTGALIPGATLTLDNTTTVTSQSDGHYRLPCVAPGKHTLSATEPGFSTQLQKFTSPRAAALIFTLAAGAEFSVSVDADDEQMETQVPGATNGTTLSGKQLQTLADDPDDLKRELQQLAAMSGGSPANTTISVDGFQTDSQLPPKDSIAYINVAPDLFSAEYREPPFDGGGRVEIYTKPGAKTFHGSLYTTLGPHWLNAQDPFSTSNQAISKQRYGFDFSGPLAGVHRTFTLSLEHRAINNVAVVNAIVPGANPAGVNFLQTVPTPQRLWEGSARADFQFGPSDIFNATYQANVDDSKNLGVGGSALIETGYEDGSQDHVIRMSNVATLSPRLIDETRFSVEHETETFVPTSSAPSQQVAGYFTGGGATIGNQRFRALRFELDNNLVLNTKKHLIKIGVQALFFRRNDSITLNMNGTYVYSGFTAANGAYTSALQQYETATSPGGTATEFNNVVGTPYVPLSLGRTAFFYQDNVKFNAKWSASYGLRYFFETGYPTQAYNGIAPRAGISYTPDKKATWQLSSHIGLFNDQFSTQDARELLREDGVHRVTSLVYNPVYGSPFVGATPIHEYRQRASNLNLPTYTLAEFNVQKQLPGGFNINAQSVFIHEFSATRTLNINSPQVTLAQGAPVMNSPFAQRPLTPNVNILQTGNTGSGEGHGEFAGLSNFKLKHVQFFLAGLHINIRDDSNDSDFTQPQSAYTNAGEFARKDSQGLWMMFGNVSFTLPYKLAFTMNGFAQGATPFNLVTGADNNGDGNFNDRPQYAPAGSAANGTTIFQTPVGLLTNAGAYVNGVPLAPIQRNLGALPWTFHLDANLQHVFKLTHDAKAAHPQTLTANIRSSNFLNHTNVTAEGNVLGSQQFLIPIAADNGRRIEFGARYSF
jgi:hypothetical protein